MQPTAPLQGVADVSMGWNILLHVDSAVELHAQISVQFLVTVTMKRMIRKDSGKISFLVTRNEKNKMLNFSKCVRKTKMN